MTPYVVGHGNYGYDSSVGLVCGANVEDSINTPFPNVANGYVNGCVIADNNLEGGMFLDYFNTPDSVLNTTVGFIPTASNINGIERAFFSLYTWQGYGFCTGSNVSNFNYPGSFSLLDRRESSFGFVGPYAGIINQSATMAGQVHLGGIGTTGCAIPPSYCTPTCPPNSGQQWYLRNLGSNPYIITEMPSNSKLTNCGDLEELSFFIDEAYMQFQNGSASASVWQNAFKCAMSQYPFGAPREALHFIQASRATEAWNYSTSTFPLVDGLTALQMTQNAITNLLTPCGTKDITTGNYGAYGTDGGLAQSWSSSTTGSAGCGTGVSDRTPEPNMQAMSAFYPFTPDDFNVHGSPITPTVMISANATSLTVNNHVSLTATSSVDIGAGSYTGWNIKIVNFGNSSLLNTCTSGFTCTATAISDVATTVQYYSIIVDASNTLQASSGFATVSWFNTTSIGVTLSSSATIVPIGTSVLLTATISGLPPGQESYSIFINDLNANTTLVSCDSGLVCSTTVVSEVPYTDSYQAELLPN